MVQRCAPGGYTLWIRTPQARYTFFEIQHRPSSLGQLSTETHSITGCASCVSGRAGRITFARFTDGPPDSSNFYCLPGKGGGLLLLY